MMSTAENTATKPDVYGATGADLIPLPLGFFAGRCSLAGTGPGVHTGIQGGEHCGSRKFDLRALGHRTTRFSDPAHPHCRVSRRMPSPDIGVGTWLSVYVSGITATAQENPPSDDLPISIRSLSRRLHEPESPVESLAGNFRIEDWST
jgi:hypothetical protein